MTKGLLIEWSDRLFVELPFCNAKPLRNKLGDTQVKKTDLVSEFRICRVSDSIE